MEVLAVLLLVVVAAWAAQELQRVVAMGPVALSAAVVLAATLILFASAC